MGYFSNGTEQEEYEARVCSGCKHYEGQGGRWCAVMQVHWLLNYDECNNKDSALHVLIPRGEKGENLECEMRIV
jgi:hypothetical protein